MTPNDPATGSTDRRASLDAFEAPARNCTHVRVVVESGEYRVLGVNAAAAASAAPLEAPRTQTQPDSNSAFVLALAEAYGDRLSSAVAREFLLQDAAGQALSSQTVLQAGEAGRLAQQVLLGVDFLTLLEHSAVSEGVQFRRLSAELGLDTRALAPQARHDIDSTLQRKCSSLQALSATPLSPRLASEWLKYELLLLTI